MGDTSDFLHLEILAPAEPEEGFLQQTDYKVAARRPCRSPPTERAAFDMPEQEVGFFFQLNDLVSVVVEDFGEGLGADFDFHLQREQAKGQVGDADKPPKFMQSVLETSATDAKSEPSSAVRTIHRVKGMVHGAEISEREAEVEGVGWVVVNKVGAVGRMKQGGCPRMTEDFFECHEDDPSHFIGVVKVFFLRRMSVHHGLGWLVPENLRWSRGRIAGKGEGGRAEGWNQPERRLDDP